MVRILFAIVASTTLLAAESYPSWWNYASPDSTALVGIQWENIRQSEFADAVTSELSGAGSLGLSGPEAFKEARQILISGPDLLAIAAGTFPASAFRTQAVQKKFKPATYRGAELWISPDRTTLSMARLSDAIVLVGARKTLEAAIDRSLIESGRRYCPLLARAAKIAPGRDLWVIATELPDPLASRFVPLDAAAINFEGAVVIGDGLALDATFQAGSEQAATTVADELRKSLPGLPLVAQGLEVTTEGNTIFLALHVSQSQLSANLRHADPRQAKDENPAAAPVEKPSDPQVIRIFGLDEGVREIVLPPSR